MQLNLDIYAKYVHIFDLIEGRTIFNWLISYSKNYYFFNKIIFILFIFFQGYTSVYMLNNGF